MLANNTNNSAQFGTLGQDIHAPSTFREELLEFIGGELPTWRDRSDRPNESSETVLTSQLCGHLNSAARHSEGWDNIQFRVEEADEQQRGRKIDLVASACGPAIHIEGRRHTEFDSLMPLECKRMPTPAAKERDEREYVFSKYSSTGGIQRFKAGHHGALHNLGAMVGYVQAETTSIWDNRVSAWIENLAGEQPGWTTKDLLRLEKVDSSLRFAVYRSNHARTNGLPEIELRHFWLEMS